MSEKEDLRKYLEKDELMRLSDFELMLQRTTSKTQFKMLKDIIDEYYKIAELRRKIKEIREMSEKLKKKKENSDDS